MDNFYKLSMDKLNKAKSWYEIGLAYHKDRLDNLTDCQTEEDRKEYNRGYVEGQTARIRDMASKFFAELDEICAKYPHTFIFLDSAYMIDGLIVDRTRDGGFKVRPLGE